MSKRRRESVATDAFSLHHSRRRPLSDDGEAFLHDPRTARARSRVDLAEKLAEDFVSSATSAEHGETMEARAPEDFVGLFSSLGEESPVDDFEDTGDEQREQFRLQFSVL